jgi:hypothetical protein
VSIAVPFEPVSMEHDSRCYVAALVSLFRPAVPCRGAIGVFMRLRE